MVSVLIAPDKFKGSLTADDVARALERGLLDGAPHARIRRLAPADGGEGSVAAACAGGRFSPEAITVTGPTGLPVTAYVAADARTRTAVVEAAAICGLGVLPDGRTTPLTATSRGVGEAVRHAVAGGADTVVLALGGVATTDGGAGLLQALGAVLARDDGTPVGPGGRGLADLRTGDLAAARSALAGVDLVLATDVDNPLLGPTGAAAVYGPQKGATASDVRTLDTALGTLVRELEAAGGPGAAGVAGAGGVARPGPRPPDGGGRGAPGG
ncbi:glycerate kinase, partial [Streptomyces sp. NPDC059850]|uniref:glycerate kinase n=1 Tax=Streptomyces sp. NPDC059850 TaxID=3346970 RepID=UPI00364F0CD3